MKKEKHPVLTLTAKKHKTGGQSSNLNAHVHKATPNSFTAKTTELNLFWNLKKKKK